MKTYPAQELPKYVGELTSVVPKDNRLRLADYLYKAAWIGRVGWFHWKKK